MTKNQLYKKNYKLKRNYKMLSMNSDLKLLKLEPEKLSLQKIKCFLKTKCAKLRKKTSIDQEAIRNILDEEKRKLQ